MHKYFSVLFILALTTCLTAQQIRFERIATREGLSQNSVTSICQDSTGFMWFGTYSGLNRYDGYNYKVFKNELNNPTSLGNDFIRALCVDESGALWIGTNGGGLNKYDSEKENFIRYMHNPGDSGSISHNSITALLADRNGNLWIGTFGGGINVLARSQDFRSNHEHQNVNSHDLKFIHYSHFDVKVDNTFWDFINGFYEDKSGLIWIGTRNGLTKYDPVKNKFTHYFHQPANPSSLSSNIVNSICEDKYGGLWVGTWDLGLNLYDRARDIFIPYSSSKSNLRYGGNESIIHLLKDRSGDLWIATFGKGLGKLLLANPEENKNGQKQRYDIIYYQNDPNNLNSLGSDNIYTIFEDRAGVLWIGTDWGGLNKFNKMKSNMVCYSSSPTDPKGLNQNVILTILKDQHDVLWLGTRSGGINLFDLPTGRFSYFKNNPNDPNSLMSNIVLTIYEDKNQIIWIGTANGLNEYSPAGQKFIPHLIQPDDPASTYIFSICEDKFGYLWLGTYGNGLYKFDKKTGKTINYRFNAADSGSLGDNTIWAIHEDRYGDLWIGTNTGGLNKFERETGRFIRYTHNADINSITDNKVLTIYEDKSGDLWLGTTLGLNKLIRGTGKESNPAFIHFSREDGLSSNTIHGILEDDHGNLWISSNNGISKFNPESRKVKIFSVGDGLQDIEFNANSCFKDEKSGKMFFGGINGLNIFHPDSIKDNLTLPNIVILDLKIFNKSIPVGKEVNGRIILDKSIIVSREVKLDYTDNVFSIEFAALNFSSPGNNLYAYRLEGFENNWNFVDARQRTVTYTNLDPGTYTFSVKASNDDGIWNERATRLKIIVTPPFWLTWWFRLSITFLIAVMFIAFYKIRTARILQINKELEARVAKRTEELEMTNKELESFSYSVSHDLRTPLRGMSGFSEILLEEYADVLDQKGKEYLQRIDAAGKHMGLLIDDILKLSRITRSKMVTEHVNLSSIVESILAGLKQKEPARKTAFKISKSLVVRGDKALLTIMLQNLLNNAWKFTSGKPETVIEFGKTSYNNRPVFFVKDNGIGFENKDAGKIFEVFTRLPHDFAGTGVGLATVQRIIIRHSGRIWAEGKINEGATFYFILES